METKGRALFNLIRMNWQEDVTLPIEGWEVVSYRSLPIEELFDQLKKFDIILDEKRFLEYAGNCLSPEDLIEMLWVLGNDPVKFDRAYLLLFELWRRLLPEKPSLSIFCDEVDRLIDEYDRSLLENEELLQDALSNLERVCDEHADHGEDPHEVFSEISSYCAHDLASFIYDYASKQLDLGHLLYASELVEGFYDYVPSVRWFDFLRIRMIAESDEEEAGMLLEQLLDSLKTHPDFELLLEIARFLVHRGVASHFLRTIKQAKNLMETEQDFQELLAIVCEFFRLFDLEKIHKELLAILKSRQKKNLDESVDAMAVDNFYKLLKDFDRSEV